MYKSWIADMIFGNLTIKSWHISLLRWRHSVFDSSLVPCLSNEMMRDDIVFLLISIPKGGTEYIALSCLMFDLLSTMWSRQGDFQDLMFFLWTCMADFNLHFFFIAVLFLLIFPFGPKIITDLVFALLFFFSLAGGVVVVVVVASPFGLC